MAAYRECGKQVEQEPNDLEASAALPQPSPSSWLGEDVKRMISRVAGSDARIKNQARGEPDLTLTQKEDILSHSLKRNPGVFLEKYGSFLASEDLACFGHLKGDYVIDFYLKQTAERLDLRKNSVKTKNRRYGALRQLLEGGRYFSDTEMRSRDPLMYEQYVGQYLSQEERAQLEPEIDKSDLRFSTILFDSMFRVDRQELYRKQQEDEDNMIEEMDSDDDDEAVQTRPRMMNRMKDEDSSEDEDDIEIVVRPDDLPTPSTAEERALYREELVSRMQQKFLEGGDPDFDYDSVDRDAAYEAIDIRQQDEEEEYFDREEPLQVGVDREPGGVIDQSSEGDYNQMDLGQTSAEEALKQ